MKKIDFFQIFYDEDSTEGRGRMLPLDIAFTTESEAVKYVLSPNYYEQYGVMGCKTSFPSTYIKPKVLKIFETYEELLDKQAQDRIDNIKTKLTKEEIEHILKNPSILL